MALAKRLINGHTSHFDLSAYRNDSVNAVRKLIEAKRKGQPVPKEEPKPAKGKVVNIMDALRNSLAETSKPAKRSSRRRRIA